MAAGVVNTPTSQVPPCQYFFFSAPYSPKAQSQDSKI
jgi:hypothetical protein